MIPLDNNDFGDLNILQASYLLQIRKATFLILHIDDVTIPPTYPILHDDDDIVIVKQVLSHPPSRDIGNDDEIYIL